MLLSSTLLYLGSPMLISSPSSPIRTPSSRSMRLSLGCFAMHRTYNLYPRGALHCQAEHLKLRLVCKRWQCLLTGNCYNSFITSRQRTQPLPLLRPLLLLYTLGARGEQVQPHNRGHRRSGIPASRSITTPRFSALCNLAKAPSAVRLRVRCDLAVIPVLSFSEERVGEVSLDLKSAPSETARAVIHRGLVTEQQNQRRGTASILTTADLGYFTALQGATIRSQPLFFSSLRSCSRISISSTKQSILSSVFINTKLEVFGY
ncbi:hypothetical protein B296_00029191 [Ensete ventricosum]|uniref:Uncharacterized protein n=1 Tax=Ensete ventricosum TaxID=4639 RepID=A0A426Y9L7_ENSVE|nr:hypothetical protein B296_00029191 [Ensete ventricosum]